MMHVPAYAALGATLALAAPLAQADAFDDCVTDPVGQGACTPERLGEALSLLSPGSFRPFHDAGMESFAMAFVMRQLWEGVATRMAGGTCADTLELEYTVDDIWFSYVHLPDDAPDAVRQDYGRFERLRDHALDFALAGDC